MGCLLSKTCSQDSSSISITYSSDDSSVSHENHTIYRTPTDRYICKASTPPPVKRKTKRNRSESI